MHGVSATFATYDDVRLTTACARYGRVHAPTHTPLNPCHLSNASLPTDVSTHTICPPRAFATHFTPLKCESNTRLCLIRGSSIGMRHVQRSHRHTRNPPTPTLRTRRRRARLPYTWPQARRSGILVRRIPKGVHACCVCWLAMNSAATAFLTSGSHQRLRALRRCTLPLPTCRFTFHWAPTESFNRCVCESCFS